MQKSKTIFWFLFLVRKITRRPSWTLRGLDSQGERHGVWAWSTYYHVTSRLSLMVPRSLTSTATT